ncbi:MAG: spondin domain-containing protein [Phycisphaerales bacterium]
MKSSRIVVVGLLAAVGAAGVAGAQPVQLRVTVQNLAPANSVSFAPLRVGFNNGTFDAFNNGMAATAPIISIAEGGTGSDWFPAFAAADPTATLGTVVGMPPGPLLPGATASTVFTVDPSVNRFFTFGSMVVPSNDHFIGNDNPMQYMLFDAMGNLNITTISQFGRSIWDNGSETEDPANAAFLVGGVNDQRTPQNGVVNFNFDLLDTFNGLTTAAGYTFNRQFGANDEVYRIAFEVVPAPGAAALLGLAGLVGLRRRR